MKSKDNVSFDKLDLQCYNELPLLIDVLSSTLNKIGSLISIYHDDLLKMLRKELKGKKGWVVNQEDKLLYYPLTNNPKRKIQLIVPCIEVFNQIYIVKKHGNKIKNAFSVYIGLSCNYADGEKYKKFYYSINREYESVKKFGILYSEKFYENLCKKVNDLDWELWHPNDDSDAEDIYLECDELSIEKLNNYFERFKANLVIPYIRNLE